jgi:molybdopterin-guanine dinucleotide biosynthesis protein A
VILPADTAVLLLCGGKSLRFGSDKALALVAGRPLLDRTIDVARRRADRVLLAPGRAPRYADRGVPLVLDPPGTQGPLAGITAGLRVVDAPFVFLLAVDLPGLSVEALDRLTAAFGEEPPVDLVMPKSRAGREPLLSFGRRTALLTAAEELLGEPHPAPRLLADRMPTRFLEVPDDPDDPLARAIVNANRVQDLDRFSA